MQERDANEKCNSEMQQRHARETWKERCKREMQEREARERDARETCKRDMQERGKGDARDACTGCSNKGVVTGCSHEMLAGDARGRCSREMLTEMRSQNARATNQTSPRNPGAENLKHSRNMHARQHTMRANTCKKMRCKIRACEEMNRTDKRSNNHCASNARNNFADNRRNNRSDLVLVVDGALALHDNDLPKLP